MARKKNTDHGTSYKEFDGYMTAWFSGNYKEKMNLKRYFQLAENYHKIVYIKICKLI